MVAALGEELNRADAPARRKQGKSLSICFVAHYAYRALTGLGQGHLGGVERQTAIMAKWLAARGHDVSVLVWKEPQDTLHEIDGLRVIPLCEESSGLRMVRFIHPRSTSLFRAMRNADASVYYHNCAEATTGVVAAGAKRMGRRFVYSVASDPDVDPRLPAVEKRYERVLYRWGLKRAHRVLVQTAKQQRVLAHGFGLSSVVLPMPCAGPGPETPLALKPDQARVLWVGRVDPVKRLDVLLDVAMRMPDIAFNVVVANIPETDYDRHLRVRAHALPNVDLVGPVPHCQLANYYRAATCLCCTSSFEGFPNTFIEAWSHGRPIVTSFDPDNLVMQLNLGEVASRAEDFVGAIRSLAHSDDRWATQSSNARRYYLKNHQVEIAMPRFEQQFLDLCQIPQGAARPRRAVR